MRNKNKSLSTPDRILKWIGAGTLVFGVLPLAVIVAWDMPGIIREVKIEAMSWKGGWRQSGRPISRLARRRSAG